MKGYKRLKIFLLIYNNTITFNLVTFVSKFGVLVGTEEPLRKNRYRLVSE